MPKLKLTYFDYNFWKGELPRILLSLGDIDYEDNRIKSENWAELKPTTPFGYMPILEVDGKWLTQGSVIIKYVARLAGLIPEDEFDVAKIDELIRIAEEHSVNFSRMIFRPENEEKKKTLREEFAADGMYKMYDELNKVFESTGKNGRFMFGEKLTAGDLFVWRFVGWLSDSNIEYFPDKETQLAKYPSLKKCVEAVEKHDGVIAYKAQFPKFYK
eukprot:snap_masked-scaffold_25-processed-gene-4.22-mRNA-1 protein AED:0.21 eAED:0.21 QI:0/-1/0/1/-1/1/1/0/214